MTSMKIVRLRTPSGVGGGGGCNDDDDDDDYDDVHVLGYLQIGNSLMVRTCTALTVTHLTGTHIRLVICCVVVHLRQTTV